MLDTFMGTPPPSPTNDALRLIDLVKNADLYEKRLIELGQQEQSLREAAGIIDTLKKAQSELKIAEAHHDEAEKIELAAHDKAEVIILEAKDRAKAADEVAGDNITQAKDKNKKAKAILDTANGKLADAEKQWKASAELMKKADKKMAAVDRVAKEVREKRNKLNAALKDL
jgi:hypothetical protein